MPIIFILWIHVTENDDVYPPVEYFQGFFYIVSAKRIKSYSSIHCWQLPARRSWPDLSQNHLQIRYHILRSCRIDLSGSGLWGLTQKLFRKSQPAARKSADSTIREGVLSGGGVNFIQGKLEYGTRITRPLNATQFQNLCENSETFWTKTSTHSELWGWTFFYFGQDKLPGWNVKHQR